MCIDFSNNLTEEKIEIDVQDSKISNEKNWRMDVYASKISKKDEMFLYFVFLVNIFLLWIFAVSFCVKV